MTKTKIEIDIPAGYRFVGHRKVRKNEYFLDEGRASLWYCDYTSNCEFIVLEKIPTVLKYRMAKMRNALSSSMSLGAVYSTEEEQYLSDRGEFVEWVTDWIEVEVNND